MSGSPIENKENIVELAKKARLVLNEASLSDRHITSVLGCGTTLISMYLSDNNKNSGSEMTAYVLRHLTNSMTVQCLTGEVRRSAAKRFPSYTRLKDEVGPDAILNTFKVSLHTLKRWDKDAELHDLWGNHRPAIRVAAFRMLALTTHIHREFIKKITDQQEQEEPELEVRDAYTPNHPLAVDKTYDKQALVAGIKRLHDVIIELDLTPKVIRDVHDRVADIGNNLHVFIEDERKRAEDKLETLSRLTQR